MCLLYVEGLSEHIRRAEVGEGKGSEPCHGCDDQKWVSESVFITMDESRKEV